MSNLRTLRLLSTCRISPTEFYLKFSDLPTSRFVAEHFSSDLTFSFMTLNLPSNVSCCLTFTEKKVNFSTTIKTVQLLLPRWRCSGNLASDWSSADDVVDVDEATFSFRSVPIRDECHWFQLTVFSKQAQAS